VPGRHDILREITGADLQLSSYADVPDTFWGARFGMLTDQFGINWMFNFDHPKQA
jgi:uncharacterized glyoxalase superfamily protein PhnB